MKVSSYHCARLNRKMFRFTGHFPHFGRRTRVGFLTREDAREAAGRLWQEGQRRAYGLVPPDAPKVTVKQLVERRKRHVRPQAARFLERWLKSLPSGMLVTELETSHFRGAADARLEAGIKPQTVFREQTDVFAMLNAAREYFSELKSWTPPARPTLSAPEGERQAYYAPEKVAEIVRSLTLPRGLTEHPVAYEARLDCAEWFTLALLTRLRSSELRTRRWADLNFNWRTLRVDKTKVGATDQIKLSAACVDLLKRRFERCGRESEYIFYSRRDPSRPVKRFSTDILKRACEAAGLKWGYKDPSGVVLHTTRHSAVTAMMEGGAQLEAARRLVGHSKKTMTARYGQASPRSEDEALTALDVFAEPLSGLLSKNSAEAAPDAANAAEPEGPRRVKTRIKR